MHPSCLRTGIDRYSVLTVVLLPQAARDRDADMWRQFAELAGGERAEPREHHLTARLARAPSAARVPACARAASATNVRRRLLNSAHLAKCAL